MGVYGRKNLAAVRLPRLVLHHDDFPAIDLGRRSQASPAEVQRRR